MHVHHLRMTKQSEGRSGEARQQPVAPLECAWDTLVLGFDLWHPRRSTLEGPRKMYDIVFI